MILNNLTVTNFGTFRGQQRIDLSPRPSRPLVLLGGMNGAGKTTLLEAIQLCLYGPSALGTRPGKDAYLAYVDGRIHTNPNLLIQPTYASVCLDFQYADPGSRHGYRVTRSWERRGGQKVSEHLQIERDGRPLDDLSTEHWQDFVRDLIPPGVVQFFFFDGEKIQQLAEDSADQRMLSDSIKALLGLDVVERLQADMGIYLMRLNKEGRNGRLQDEDAALEKELDAARDRLAALRRNREQIEAELNEIRTALGHIEEKITAEGGGFARNRNRLIERQAELKTQLYQQEDTLRHLSSGLLPFALAQALCQQLRDQLLLENEAKAAAASSAILAKAKKRIRKRLSEKTLWDGVPKLPVAARRVILERLQDVIESALPRPAETCTPLVHELSSESQAQLLSWIDQATGEVPARLQDLSAEIERILRELEKVERQLRRAPSDEALGPLMDELREQNHRLTEVSKHSAVKDEEIRSAEYRLAEIERRYKKASERRTAEGLRERKALVVPRVQSALEDYKLALIQRTVAQLEAAVSDCFNRLCRKRDALRKIRIDPHDFSVTLLDKRGQRIPKAQLSAGEKQIFAISMLWALAKTSGRPLPIIIDTPLGRLDSAHRQLLVENYFPVASHQVLILSTDTEVDSCYFQALRRDIAHAYRLEFDQADCSTTVHPGYFWEMGNEAQQAPAH
jgi:DNA sulfur modification protein DndD